MHHASSPHLSHLLPPLPPLRLLVPLSLLTTPVACWSVCHWATVSAACAFSAVCVCTVSYIWAGWLLPGMWPVMWRPEKRPGRIGKHLVVGNWNDWSLSVHCLYLCACRAVSCTYSPHCICLILQTNRCCHQCAYSRIHPFQLSTYVFWLSSGFFSFSVSTFICITFSHIAHYHCVQHTTYLAVILSICLLFVPLLFVHVTQTSVIIYVIRGSMCCMLSSPLAHAIKPRLPCRCFVCWCSASFWFCVF